MPQVMRWSRNPQRRPGRLLMRGGVGSRLFSVAVADFVKGGWCHSQSGYAVESLVRPDGGGLVFFLEGGLVSADDRQKHLRSDLSILQDVSLSGGTAPPRTHTNGLRQMKRRFHTWSKELWEKTTETTV